jgi:DNA replication and repair protein RecF
LFCSELKIQNFRLFSNCVLRPGPHLNFFSGDNAQGKTTLLEALRLLSTGRSFVTKTLREAVQFERGHFHLSAEIRREILPLSIRFGWSERRKAALINGEALSILSDLIGRFDTVLFTPDDFNLVSGRPDRKRRYLDIQLSQADRRYLIELKRYHKILKNRNALLKTRFDRSELAPWTDQLIEAGSRVIRMRRKAVNTLNRYSDHHLKTIAAERERLVIRYKCLAHRPDEPVDTQFRETLERSRRRESELGFTLCGPHRDDLEFELNGVDAKKHASRGQLKSIAVSLKLAEAALLHKVKNRWPVFLIDDIFPELDERRQRGIQDLLARGQQVFAVSAHAEIFLKKNAPGDVKTFRIQSGDIRETS